MGRSPPIQPQITKSTVLLVSHSPRPLFDKAPTHFRVAAGSQTPWLDSSGAVVYFQTPKLADGTHKIDITVSVANLTNPYIIDFFLIAPTAGASNSGVQTSRTAPSPTVPISVTHPSTTPVGAIVGGVVGGIAAIALLLFALWFFVWRKKRGGQAYYFDKPKPADMLAAEGQYTVPSAEL